MVVPTFLKVSESNECTLADLKVTGYLPAVFEKRGKDKSAKPYDGCGAGTFTVSLLTVNGTEDKAYMWLDTYTKAGEKVGPGWFDGDGNEIVGGAKSVELPAGKGLWIQGSGLKLQPAGVVNPFDIAFKTVDSGSSAVGNCTPVDLTLGDLTVTGYLPAVFEKRGKDKSAKPYDGCGAGTFTVSFLTVNGTEDKAYMWLDTYTKAGEKVGPGWFDGDGNEIVGGAKSVELPAGKGLWIQGSGLKLVIPAPEL